MYLSKIYIQKFFFVQNIFIVFFKVKYWTQKNCLARKKFLNVNFVWNDPFYLNIIKNLKNET